VDRQEQDGRSVEELSSKTVAPGIMREALAGAPRACTKSCALAQLFLRAHVPWIAKNKMVDQSKN
jgi:hypothetical protein